MTFNDEYKAILRLKSEEDKKYLYELPDYWETSPAIQAEIALFTRNLKDTINFLDNDCDGEQLGCLSEVFDPISAKLQSWEFIDAILQVAKKFPEETKKYSIDNFIASAIGQLNDSVYEQRYKLKNKRRGKIKKSSSEAQ
jgi:hypothetical protein